MVAVLKSFMRDCSNAKSILGGRGIVMVSLCQYSIKALSEMYTIGQLMKLRKTHKSVIGTGKGGCCRFD